MFNHPPFFFVFFAAMWVSVLYLIAMVSGWYELSKRFRFKGKFYGESLPFRSARMRFYVHFGNSLTVGADQSGLYLAVFPIFRIGHPHLLIPWSEVVVISGETGLIFKKRELRLGPRSRSRCVSAPRWSRPCASRQVGRGRSNLLAFRRERPEVGSGHILIGAEVSMSRCNTCPKSFRRGLGC